jgi:hypothetical protein
MNACEDILIADINDRCAVILLDGVIVTGDICLALSICVPSWAQDLKLSMSGREMEIQSIDLFYMILWCKVHKCKEETQLKRRKSRHFKSMINCECI